MSDDDIGRLVTFGAYAGIAALFICRWIALARHRRKLREGTLLEPLAAELGREVARDPSAPVPFLRLDVRGLRAYFSLWPFSDSSTRVISLLEIRVGAEGFLEATSRRGLRHPTTHTRITQVDTASNYTLMTSDPRWARRVATDDFLGVLGDLERRLNAPLRLRLTASHVTLEAERLLGGPDLQAFLEGAARLIDLLNLSPTAEGVAILDATLATGRCPVCGVRAEPPVACAACRTPQHAECWAYLGRCGIFGCGGAPLR